MVRFDPSYNFGPIPFILVGDVPFFGNDQMEVFIKILTKQPDYPEYVDNHSKMVIDGLLEKEPKRRFSAGMLFSDSGFVFCGDSNHVTEYPCRLIYGLQIVSIWI